VRQPPRWSAPLAAGIGRCGLWETMGIAWGNVFGYTRGQQALSRLDLLIAVNGVARFVVVLALSRDLRVRAPGVSVCCLLPAHRQVRLSEGAR